MKSSRFQMTKKTTSIRGLQTSWIEMGENHQRLMIFLHGFPDDALVWQHQMEHFSKRYHIMAPMMRGVGESEPGGIENRFGFHAHALDVMEILAHVDPQGRKKIVLVGHDLGSVHAWFLAPLLVERLAGLVVINGAHPLQFIKRIGNLRQVIKSWYMFLFALPILPELLMKTAGSLFARLAHHYGGMPEVLQQRRLWSWHRKSKDFMRYSIKQYRQILSSLPGLIQSQSSFKLKAPLLAISALQDPFLEPTSLEELQDLAHSPTVRMIEGRHWVQKEKSQRVNQLIEGFLKNAKPSR